MQNQYYEQYPQNGNYNYNNNNQFQQQQNGYKQNNGYNQYPNQYPNNNFQAAGQYNNGMPQNQNFQNNNNQPTNQNAQKSVPLSGFSYPKQAWDRKNSEKGIFIQDNLAHPAPEEYENRGGKLQPLSQHSKYSRLKIEILNYANVQSASWNFSPQDIAILNKKAESLVMIDTMKKYKPEASESGLAYTQIIAGGDPAIKGKTPVQSLMENPQQNYQKLISQTEWLQKNLGKYKTNQDQLNAILQALELYNQGKLATAALPIIIYDQQKVVHQAKYPEEFVPFASCKIVCNFNMNYPITIAIQNGDVQTIDKTTPNMKTMRNKRDYNYVLSLADWVDAIDYMYITKINFENEAVPEKRAAAVKALLINMGNGNAQAQ